ncbi:MAG TPA: c-type cytochrome domain-containing protein [Fimbriiglobus sp.]|nr:c-type cytochrome domain-containing protein [Fimbriiglobus sp.]
MPRPVLTLLPATLLTAIGAAADPAPPAGKVSYFRDVRPIFQQHCQGCHQPAKPGGGYVMTAFAGLTKPGESGLPGVVPGNPADSHLLAQVTPKDGKAEMPRDREPLKPAQVETIARWIREGAADDTPASARGVLIDAEHPPEYRAPPVVTAVAFSPDGKLLAVAGYHEILLHDTDHPGRPARLVGMSERVQSIAFSPNGKYLAAAAGDPGRFGEVQVWDVAKRELKLSAPVTYDTVYGVSWSPDGTAIAFGCADNTVRAIDAFTGRQVLQMGTHADWVLGTAFSRDGKHLVSVSRDMTLKLTEVATQRFIDNVTSITPGALKGGLMALDVRPITPGRWLQKRPDDTPGAPRKLYDELLSAGSDGTPRLYKMHRETKRVIGDDANRIKEYEAMPGRVSCVAFDDAGRRFAAASSLDGKGQVRVYDVATGKNVVLEKVTGPAYTVAWHPSGNLVASAGFDGKVWLHDPATGKLVKEFVAVPYAPDKIPLARAD